VLQSIFEFREEQQTSFFQNDWKAFACAFQCAQRLVVTVEYDSSTDAHAARRGIELLRVSFNCVSIRVAGGCFVWRMARTYGDEGMSLSVCFRTSHSTLALVIEVAVRPTIACCILRRSSSRGSGRSAPMTRSDSPMTQLFVSAAQSQS
jgi:hypothetical protein